MTATRTRRRPRPAPAPSPAPAPAQLGVPGSDEEWERRARFALIRRASGVPLDQLDIDSLARNPGATLDDTPVEHTPHPADNGQGCWAPRAENQRRWLGTPAAREYIEGKLWREINDGTVTLPPAGETLWGSRAAEIVLRRNGVSPAWGRSS